MKKKEEAVTDNKSNKGPVYRTSPGPVQASVFVNKTKEGVEFPAAVINRRYHDQKKQAWVNSSSYGLKHIDELARVVADVQSWMKANYPTPQA
jgi:hypothetical protein